MMSFSFGSKSFSNFMHSLATCASHFIEPCRYDNDYLTAMFNMELEEHIDDALDEPEDSNQIIAFDIRTL